ncbi:ADP-ribosylglycohydrolase family protein [Synechocystis sp. LKSZ1]|uniref:ADP-ribosylglycohydrolase family protein n=1 Tax=Synechocystis sp. LKSZ1 TaxID=3144951 RepID=UPI00336C1939
MSLSLSDRLTGCLLGTAVGDALGLPYEGLSRGRGQRLLGLPNRYRLLGPYGFVSDDTEHACMTAQALIASGGIPARFADDLAWRLRWWLLALPAGIGLATLRAIIKLWLGFSADRAGVFSAGNGPGMRAAILGAAVVERDQLQELIHYSTYLTHTDPKAEQGAWVIALATRLACEQDVVSPQQFLKEVETSLDETAQELLTLIYQAVRSVEKKETTPAFAQSLGLEKGVSGYMFHTVPVVIHAWLSYPHNYEQAVQALIVCGGDTDSTAAMAGGIIGAAVGKAGIPKKYLEKLVEWPRTVDWMQRLAEQLAEARVQQCPLRPVSLPFWGVWIRNLGFMLIVLGHGLRRLAPPW